MFLIGGVTFLALYIALLLICRKLPKKRRKKVREDKEGAAALLQEGKPSDAIEAWKKMLPLVGQRDVEEIIPLLRGAYETGGDAEGMSKVDALERFYKDFFEMSWRQTKLDAKGRPIGRNLAGRICREVAALSLP